MSTASTSRGLLVGAAALTLGVFIAGCGSSGTAASSPSSTAGSASSSVSTVPSTTAPETSPASSQASSAPTGAVDLTGHFCADARAEDTRSEQLVAQFTAGNPASLKALAESSGAILQQFESEAPAAIKAPATILINGDEQLFKQLAAADYDYTKLSPAALSSFESPAFLAATKTVAAYLSTTCHIAPSS